MMASKQHEARSRVSTGTEGLDEVLGGGLIPAHAYLVVGEPGTGKTTLALQFAREGARRDERVLFITLSQTTAGLKQIAGSHGWSLEGIEIEDPYHSCSLNDRRARQHTIHPADVELIETSDRVRELFEEVRPDRFVFDSVGVLRTLASGQAHRYHSEVASLIRLVEGHGATSLVVGPADACRQDGEWSTAADAEIHMLFHGSIRLRMTAPPYGAVRRSIHVEKARGMAYHSGWHSCAIKTGGLAVYPRLRVSTGPPGSDRESPMAAPHDWDQMRSGVENLDAMLGGGLEFGTTTLIVGATGTGKSTLALLYAFAALRQKRQAAIFLFTERAETYTKRSRDLSMDLTPFLKNEQLHLQSIDVGELSPGALAHRLRQVVANGAKVVVIDSLTGYHHAMRDEALLQVQMHDMLNYLSQKGVLTLLVVDQHGLGGSQAIAPVDVSYMCDSLVVLRNYDEAGRIRRAIAVVKKRYGPHDMTVRELEITTDELRVGAPRPELVGVLAGTPTILSREDAGPEAHGDPDA